jgi:hypothetical protein
MGIQGNEEKILFLHLLSLLVGCRLVIDEDALKSGAELGEFFDASLHADLFVLQQRIRFEIADALREAGVRQPVEVGDDVLHLHPLHHLADRRLIVLRHAPPLHLCVLIFFDYDTNFVFNFFFIFAAKNKAKK